MLAFVPRISLACLCLLATSVVVAQTPAPTTSRTPVLPRIDPSPAERAWLDQKPTVTVGIDPSWPPFSFVDRSGAHEGIDADLVRLVASRLGLNLQIAKTVSWQQTMQQMQAKKVQLVPGVAYHAGRSPGYVYTDPYLSFPVAIVTRADGPFHVTLRELPDEVLALPRDYVTTLNVQRDYPRLRVTLTKDAAEALKMVASGDAFATVENLATATYLIKTNGLTNLKIAGLTDYQFELRFAIAADQPELASLVNQVLKGLPEDQFARICDRWIPVEFAMDDGWTRVGRRLVWVALGVLSLLGLIFLWNRRLAGELGTRRRMQDELADANLRLEAANTRLRQLNEESEMFMNIAAHDLRSPLNIILLSCEMLETQAAAATGAAEVKAPPSQRLIDGIKESVLRMNGLVQNFLSAQVIAHGDSELVRLPINFSEAVQRAVERHTPEAALKRITLTSEDGTAARVTGDAGAIDQVLDNLISNAIKFTPPDGLVRLRVRCAEGHVRLEVHDDGPGISDEDLPKLFTRFTKLKSRPTARESSTGLGLSIVKHFVTTMSGRVWCEPNAGGQGACFVVEFPALDPVHSAPSA
ncbi:hypothetical protein AYO41_02975 [Verrucomicrobia bacterium SCGC AG-212-E04]|nr:hypothetical protein AYO41_02975 [Verrucomicrobia bacterium SCGC AG-212-E04]